MSEQSLPVVAHEVPKFSELDAADWGREVVPAATEGTDTSATPATPTETTVESAPEVDPAVEVASERGWVPREQWKGPAERWVDASAFNDRYESVLPVVQKENKKMAAELRAAQTALAELTRQAQEWKQEKEQQEQTRQQLRLDTLKMERKTAIENQDWDTVVRVDDELLDLKVTQKTAPPRSTAPQQDPETMRVLQGFAEDFPIFVKDRDMESALSEQIKLMQLAQSPLRGRELLDKAKERVQRMYPERFGALPRRQFAMAETGGTPSGARTTTGKTWNDLKPEAREALDKFIRTTPGMTREEILKNAQPEHFR